MRRQSHIYRLCYLLLALVIAPQGFAEERNGAAFSAIEREMSAEERRATGIDSLSADELDALNQWLIERFDQVQETVSAEVRDEVREEVREEVLEEVREADAAEREAEIERRVAIEVEAAKQEIVDAPPEPAVSEPFEAVIQGRFPDGPARPCSRLITARCGGSGTVAGTVTPMTIRGCAFTRICSVCGR